MDERDHTKDQTEAAQNDESRAVSIDRIAFGPPPARAGLQDTELARISQEATERFYNLLALGSPNVAACMHARRACKRFGL